MGRAGSMSATELEDVQALLERVLPDPARFAERLLQQVMTRWGQSTEPSAHAFYSTATAEDAAAAATVITPDQTVVTEPPIDTNMLLAAALGACECWGLQTNCHVCAGQGSAGWIQPDPQLFEEFIEPAISRLSGPSAGGHQRDRRVKADGKNGNHQTAQGEST